MTHWGILGTGKIARAFAQGLRSLPGAELIAVGSRTQESAQAFGQEYQVPHRYASYEGVAADPGVDVMYIATPHAFHAENVRLCLEAGKAVLCEKPFTLFARQLAPLITLARAKGVFMMEAMWTRFIPAWTRVRELIAEGAIGEPRLLLADFNVKAAADPENRFFNPALGGGALLDLGVYPLAMASWFFGVPEQIQAAAHIGATGVDEQNAVQMRYAGGKLASFTCSFINKSPLNCILSGSNGYIQVPAPWWKAQRLILGLDGKDEQHIPIPLDGNGYNYEAAEVERCMRAGLLESPVMPLDESLSIMQTMDSIRAQWGMKYPGE